MFRLYPALLIAAAGLAGCVSVPMGDAARDAQLKSFAARPEAAGVYVYRNDGSGALILMDVEVDGKTLGKTGARTYFYAEVPAGRHTVTSRAENIDSIELEAVAGQLYYIRQEVRMGDLYARTRLQLVGEETGRQGVLETRLAAGR